MLMQVSSEYVGGIEAGGTKFVCAVANATNKLVNQAVIPTTTPSETMSKVVAFFKSHGAPLKAIGIGAFGPVSIDRRAGDFGKILTTPKAGWSGFDIYRYVQTELSTQIAIDTDVNCALLSESALGAGRGFRNIAYATIGTGIGAGIMIDGQMIYGSSHPEIGHMFVPILDRDADFAGVCAYHGNQCFEGLICGPAVKARWGFNSSELSADHEGWEVIAHYISLLCMNLRLAVSPDLIILGGGVMKQSNLFPIIRDKLAAKLNGYGAGENSQIDMSRFIVPPLLDGDAGVLGAIEIARRQASES